MKALAFFLTGSAIALVALCPACGSSSGGGSGGTSGSGGSAGSASGGSSGASSGGAAGAGTGGSAGTGTGGSAGSSGTTPCGSTTCGADQVCATRGCGGVPPPDGGSCTPTPQCMPLPSECKVNPTCSCFSSIWTTITCGSIQYGTLLCQQPCA